MECYACESEATRQCRRCARVYCELHGGEFCGECLNPASALPSFNLYRGSLLALLVGTAVAIWLLVRPPGPGESGAPEIAIVDVTPTAIVTGVPETVTSESPTPRATTPTARATPKPSATPRPAPTETPGPQTYTVQPGDTLVGIAQQYAPSGVGALDYAEQIASANGFGVDDPITPGQDLVLP